MRTMRLVLFAGAGESNGFESFPPFQPLTDEGFHRATCIKSSGNLICSRRCKEEEDNAVGESQNSQWAFSFPFYDGTVREGPHGTCTCCSLIKREKELPFHVSYRSKFPPFLNRTKERQK